MPHEKFLFRVAKTEIPIPRSISALKPIGNAYSASYAGQKQRFFSAGFGWLNFNKPIRNTLFGIIWCNSKQRSNSVVSSPSICA